jgi:DNA-damage-inducible protein J
MSGDFLVQVKVSPAIKEKIDTVFKRSGISTQTAIKIFLYQVANTHKTPFTDIFVNR